MRWVKRYESEDDIVDAIPLLWENWNDICEFAGVGRLGSGKPSGCFLSNDGQVVDSSDRIGLLIPSAEGLVIAVQGDYILKGEDGILKTLKREVFEERFRESEDKG